MRALEVGSTYSGPITGIYFRDDDSPSVSIVIGKGHREGTALLISVNDARTLKIGSHVAVKRWVEIEPTPQAMEEEGD